MVHSYDEKPISISHKFPPNSIAVRVLPCRPSRPASCAPPPPPPSLHQQVRSKGRASTLKWPNEFGSHNFARPFPSPSLLLQTWHVWWSTYGFPAAVRAWKQWRRYWTEMNMGRRRGTAGTDGTDDTDGRGGEAAVARVRCPRFPPPPLPVAARHRPCPSPSLAAQGLSPSPSLAPSAAAVSAAAAEALQQPQRRAYFLTNEGNFSPRHPSLSPSPPSFLLSFFFLTSALPLSPSLPRPSSLHSLVPPYSLTHSLARYFRVFLCERATRERTVHVRSGERVA